MLNKRIVCMLLVLVMIFALAACGKTDDTQDNTANDTNEVQTAADEETTDDATDETQPAKDDTAEEAKLTGELVYFDVDDRDISVLRGVSTYGNRVGSGEFNNKPAATKGIRCIFELNEYVGFVPDTDEIYGFKVWVIKHKDDLGYYKDAKFSDLLPGFASYCELRFDTDEPENNYWGEFYLNPEDCEAGYYDFVFVYEGKAIAALVTYFYNEGEIVDKPDAELEKLMFN